MNSPAFAQNAKGRATRGNTKTSKINPFFSITHINSSLRLPTLVALLSNIMESPETGHC
jgi:hypothetical protein